MNSHRAIALVFLLSATAAVAGQQATPPVVSDDKPVLTVRSGVDAVQIDVFVTDAEGMPVRGLSADDFDVFENGKPRPLAAFRAVDIPIERREEVEQQPLAEADVLSNDGPEGRVYMFVLDEVGTVCDDCDATILRTRRIVRQFIERHFGPHDIGAVALLGRGLSTDGQDFTSNRQLLLEAVDKFSGGFRGFDNNSQEPSATTERDTRKCIDQAPKRMPADMRVMGRSQQMSSLRDLAELTARLPGQHKAMLIFSECFDVDVTQMIDYKGGTWGVGGDDAHAAMLAATRSNLVIYPIDPTGLMPGGDSRSSLVLPGQGNGIPLEALMAFRGMAEMTGGFALINSNSFEQTFERIVRENSTYYMLGFDSGYEKADGRYVRVQVKVKRPGLTVHAREGYIAPTRKEKQQNARRSESAPKPVAAALASPLQTSGVTMHVSAVSMRGSGHNARVVVTTDVDASTLGLIAKDGAYSGEIEMRYIATDARRRIFPEVRQTAKVRLDPRPGAEAASPAGIVRVGTTLELPPGRYQIRVAAGTSITAGNIVYDLKVPDFSEAPLAMSGIALMRGSETGVLALSSSGSTHAAKPVKCYSSNCVAAPATVTDRALETAPAGAAPQPAIQLPTTARTFAPGDDIQLGVEVYDNQRPKKGSPSATISLTIAVRDAGGRVIQLGAEDRVSAPAGGNAPLRFALPLPLHDVPPGAYALDVSIRSNTAHTPAVTQSIPIRIEPSGR
jgi:VWFA-related protein